MGGLNRHVHFVLTVPHEDRSAQCENKEEWKRSKKSCGDEEGFFSGREAVFTHCIATGEGNHGGSAEQRKRREEKDHRRGYFINITHKWR